jgi:hypothetical protein
MRAAAETGGDPVTVGFDTPSGSQSYPPTENRWQLLLLEAPISGDVVSARVMVRQGNVDRLIGMALMNADGTTLLGHTDVQYMSDTSDEHWMEFSFDPPVSVSAGTSYRLGAIGDYGVGGPDFVVNSRTDGPTISASIGDSGNAPVPSGWAPTGNSILINDDDEPLMTMTIQP